MNTLAVHSNADRVPHFWQPVVGNGCKQSVRPGIEVDVARSAQSLDKHHAALQTGFRSTIWFGFADIDRHVLWTDSQGHQSRRNARCHPLRPVSYTHLTLPT